MKVDLAKSIDTQKAVLFVLMVIHRSFRIPFDMYAATNIYSVENWDAQMPLRKNTCCIFACNSFWMFTIKAKSNAGHHNLPWDSTKAKWWHFRSNDRRLQCYHGAFVTMVVTRVHFNIRFFLLYYYCRLLWFREPATNSWDFRISTFGRVLYIRGDRLISETPVILLNMHSPKVSFSSPACMVQSAF